MSKVEPNQLKMALRASILGHGLLILFVLVKNIIIPEKTVTYIPTLQVDLVALPDILKKDLTVQSAKQEGSQETSKAQIKPRPPEPKSAEMTIKSHSNLNSSANSREKRVENKNKRVLSRLKSLSKIQENLKTTIKGNQISPGSSLSGEAREAAETDYRDLILNRLQEHWTLPTWIERQELSARVQLWINSEGYVSKFHFEKISGNSQFDSAVKKAIEESQPFPIPPNQLARDLLSNGILFGFPL